MNAERIHELIELVHRLANEAAERHDFNTPKQLADIATILAKAKLQAQRAEAIADSMGRSH